MVKPLLANKIILLSLSVALVLNFCLWLLLWRFVRPSAELIPLHYTIYFGIDYLDFWYKIFYLPVVGLFIFISNIILAGFFYSKEKLVSYFLTLGSTVVQALLILAAVLLIIYT